MSCFADWSKRCHVTFVIIECWMCHGHLTAMLNRDVTMHHCNWWTLTCGLLQLLLLHYTLLTALCPGLLWSAGTRKVKPIWILLKQEMSGSGISWAICKAASHSRQRTTPAPHHSVFTGRMPFLPPNQQRQSTEGIMRSITTVLIIKKATVSNSQMWKTIHMEINISEEN